MGRSLATFSISLCILISRRIGEAMIALNCMSKTWIGLVVRGSALHADVRRASLSSRSTVLTLRIPTVR